MTRTLKIGSRVSWPDKSYTDMRPLFGTLIGYTGSGQGKHDVAQVIREQDKALCHPWAGDIALVAEESI